jgi:hypothetical protein
MMMTRGGLMLALGLGAVLGCRPCDLAPPARPAPPQLPLTKRGVIEPDVSALPTQPAKSPPARPEQYRRLTAAECRKLAAAEGQFDLAVAGHGVLTKQLGAAEKAIQQGLKDRGDVNAIRRQILEIESQAARLEAGTGALNASLAGRIGLEGGDATPIWPADPLRVAAEVIEVEQALATAMQYRPDLNLLRALVSDESGNRELANDVLAGINPLLANQKPTHPLALLLAAVKKDASDDSKLRRQLLGVLSSRERQAEAEVRAAVATLRGNRAAVIAKSAEVRNLVARVADLEKREEAGQQVTVELVTARMDLLKARGELVQSAADWHVADVKLRQAMGLLARE